MAVKLIALITYAYTQLEKNQTISYFGKRREMKTKGSWVTIKLQLQIIIYETFRDYVTPCLFFEVEYKIYPGLTFQEAPCNIMAGK